MKANELVACRTFACRQIHADAALERDEFRSTLRPIHSWPKRGKRLLELIERLVAQVFVVAFSSGHDQPNLSRNVASPRLYER